MNFYVIYFVILAIVIGAGYYFFGEKTEWIVSTVLMILPNLMVVKGIRDNRNPKYSRDGVNTIFKY